MELAAALKFSPLLAQCLLNRGLSDPLQITGFLEPRLKQLADPFLLPNMRAAVDRLFQARERNERVLIFGDYDVDGVTSTALLTEVLGHLGWNVGFYLPDRLEEGYGLSREAVDNCLAAPASPALLLAVDCGSTAVDTIAYLRTKNIDTIVLDHHQATPPYPAATALVNPQVGDNTAFRELCSAGLAFKLAHAVVKHGRVLGIQEAVNYDLRPVLDLVALGTIADLVPVRGENRILVTAGLERLNSSRRAGIQALRQVAGVRDRIGVFEVGFQLGPRLNAAGRLANALQSLELLLAREPGQAESLARALDLQNRERQQLERGIAERVIAAVRARFDPEKDYVIVEGDISWHRGVVGIVASRVLRAFHRPTIVMGGDGEEWRGSGRSIDGFDLAAALRECTELLTGHGGHAMAAGLSLRPANLDAFRVRLNDIARRLIAPELLQPALRVDTEVTLDQLTLETVAEFARLEPFGQANPPVHLVAKGLSHRRPPERIGRDQQHSKWWVSDVGGTYQAIWWNSDPKSIPEGTFDLAFVPEINSYNGRESVQLKVLDWRKA